MSMVSNTFLLFVLAVLILYYLVPAKAQWIVLLIFSYLYYVSGNARYLFYILFNVCYNPTCCVKMSKCGKGITNEHY